MITKPSPHHCTCPQAVGIANKRQDLADIWISQEWLEAAAAFRARRPPICERCGCEGPIVPGHTAKDYLDMATYIQKVREDKCQALCHRCNRNEAKGKHPCPGCIEKHKTDPAHWIRYIGQGEDLCRHCENKGSVPRKKKTAPRHPCSHRIALQRCLRNGQTYACEWSPKKCRACDYFEERSPTT